MRILFVGGGSVGHLAPAVAVWRAVQSKDSSAVAHFLCSDRGDDRAFLEREGIACTTVPFPRVSLLFPVHFLEVFFATQRLLRRFQPDIVFSKGGALSVPACLAARIAKIPIVLHESDAVSGRANKIVARWAKVICLGWKVMRYESRVVSENTDSSLKTHNSKLAYTGNPLRPAITQGSREQGLRLTGFSGTRPVLLVLGGSQGAQAINDIIIAELPKILALCDVIHLTGRGKRGASPQSGYWSREFVNEELPHLYAIATLALSRAGAGAIGEFAANGIPTILVPLRGLAHDHQEHNALAAILSGGCVLLEQDQLPSTIVGLLTQLLGNPAALKEMAVKIRTLHQSDSAEKIATVLRGIGGIPKA